MHGTRWALLMCTAMPVVLASRQDVAGAEVYTPALARDRASLAQRVAALQPHTVPRMAAEVAPQTVQWLSFPNARPFPGPMVGPMVPGPTPYGVPPMGYPFSNFPNFPNFPNNFIRR